MTETKKESIHVRLERGDMLRVGRAAAAVGMKPGTWVRLVVLERLAPHDGRQGQ